MNAHILLFVGKVTYTNTTILNVFNVTETVREMEWECYATNLYEFYPMWDRIHLFIYCIVPFFIIITSDLVIGYKLLNSKFSNIETINKKKKKLIKTILITTFLFLFSTVPQVIAFGWYFVELTSVYEGTLFLYVLDLIHFTFNGLNFMIFFVTNKVYRSEFMKLYYVIFKALKYGLFKILNRVCCLSDEKLEGVRENFLKSQSSYYNNNAPTSHTSVRK